MGLVLVIHHHRRGALPPEGQQGVGIFGGQTPCLGGHALEIAGPSVAGRKIPRREQLDAPGGDRRIAAGLGRRECGQESRAGEEGCILDGVHGPGVPGRGA